MMRLVNILRARSQFIQAAPVSVALVRAGVAEQLVHTGQQLDIFFEELGIPALWRQLGIGSGGHSTQTGAMLVALEPLLQDG